MAAVRNDHAVLLNLRQVLGTPTKPDSPATPPGAAVPAPRKKAAAPGERTGTRKSTAPAGKQTGKKAAAKASTVPSGPTLVDLVREHLADQREPRSAAEISTELGRQHPERTIKATVVRTTLGLTNAAPKLIQPAGREGRKPPPPRPCHPAAARTAAAAPVPSTAPATTSPG